MQTSRKVMGWRRAPRDPVPGGLCGGDGNGRGERIRTSGLLVPNQPENLESTRAGDEFFLPVQLSGPGFHAGYRRDVRSNSGLRSAGRTLPLPWPRHAIDPLRGAILARLPAHQKLFDDGVLLGSVQIGSGLVGAHAHLPPVGVRDQVADEHQLGRSHDFTPACRAPPWPAPPRSVRRCWPGS